MGRHHELPHRADVEEDGAQTFDLHRVHDKASLHAEPFVAVPPSEFVTVTLRLPVATLAATERSSVMLVGVRAVTDAVIPVPENDTTAPGAKPVPATTTV